VIAVLAVFAGVLGLAVGSFLNVVVYRVPLGRSVVRPASRCPRCGAAIRRRDNVPVLSWLLLRGRCRDCAAPISGRYPLVEGLTGVLFVGVVLRFTVVQDGAWAIPAYLYLAAIGVALALIDLDVHRLPDAIVLPSYPAAAALLALASWGAGDWQALLRAAEGGAALWVVYLGLSLVKQGAMGFGDVKLAGILGAYLGWLGWGDLAVGAFAAFFVGGLVSVGLLLAKKAGRRTAIPFGPWMLIGAAIGIAVGAPAWEAYLGTMS
jgi:leader peptidase (prepilin peptidase)/N-methyltransferase